MRHRMLDIRTWPRYEERADGAWLARPVSSVSPGAQRNPLRPRFARVSVAVAPIGFGAWAPCAPSGPAYRVNGFQSVRRRQAPLYLHHLHHRRRVLVPLTVHLVFSFSCNTPRSRESRLLLLWPFAFWPSSPTDRFSIASSARLRIALSIAAGAEQTRCPFSISVNQRVHFFFFSVTALAQVLEPLKQLQLKEKNVNKTIRRVDVFGQTFENSGTVRRESVAGIAKCTTETALDSQLVTLRYTMRVSRASAQPSESNEIPTSFSYRCVEIAYHWPSAAQWNKTATHFKNR